MLKARTRNLGRRDEVRKANTQWNKVWFGM